MSFYPPPACHDQGCAYVHLQPAFAMQPWECSVRHLRMGLSGRKGQTYVYLRQCTSTFPDFPVITYEHAKLNLAHFCCILKLRGFPLNLA